MRSVISCPRPVVQGVYVDEKSEDCSFCRLLCCDREFACFLDGLHQDGECQLSGVSSSCALRRRQDHDVWGRRSSSRRRSVPTENIKGPHDLPERSPTPSSK